MTKDFTIHPSEEGKKIQAESVSFRLNDGTEKLRLEPGGFFVDEVRVNDDPQKVYEAFCAWMSSMQLPR